MLWLLPVRNMPRRTFRFRAVWIGFGGCGSCIGCFGCGGYIVAVAIELVASGVALYFIYSVIGVFSSVFSQIDTSTSFYKNDLYRAKCLC